MVVSSTCTVAHSEQKSCSVFRKSPIEEELSRIEAREERPFPPSTKKVILRSGEDPTAFMHERIRRLRRLRHTLDGVRREFFERVLATVDFERYRDLQRELLAPQSLRAHGYRIKFLNLDYWLASKLEVALDLGLHEAKPLTILDIGVGPGHFPFICRQFGHQVVGTDVATLELDQAWPGRHVYDGLIDVLGVDRRAHTVERGTRVPPHFGGPFDLVTALMVKFDSPFGEPAWTTSDWEFFLRDLATNVLTTGGHAFLKLNRPYAGDEIMTFMEEAGGRTNRSQCTVVFEPLIAPGPA